MPKASIPPEYVNVPTSLAYRLDLSPGVRETGIQIHGLGWNHDYEYTDPVTVTELCCICGVSRARLYGHLQQLVVKGVLRYTYTAAGFVFNLRRARDAMQPSVTARAGPCTDSGLKNETGAGLQDVVVVHDLDLRDEKEHQQQYSPVLGGSRGGTRQSQKRDCEAQAADGPLDWEARLDVLVQMGVLEPVRSELAGLAWATAQYLLAWARWLKAQDGRVGSGLVVNQIRQGEHAPAVAGADRQRASPAARERYREWQE